MYYAVAKTFIFFSVLLTTTRYYMYIKSIWDLMHLNWVYLQNDATASVKQRLELMRAK